MKKPPHQYGRRYDEHPEDLITPKCTPLNLAPLLLGNLLIVRLDAAFNHECTAPVD